MNIGLLDSMIKLGIKISNPDYMSDTIGARPLDGLSFVITGRLPKSRKEVETLIETNGGHTAAAVSSGTDYLLAGDDPGSKLKKAKELGIRTISYDDLLKMIAEPGHPKLF
jgi:DNA ligase (NAD+)